MVLVFMCCRGGVGKNGGEFSHHNIGSKVDLNRKFDELDEMR